MTDIAALYQSLSADRRRLLAARLGSGGVSGRGAARQRLVAFTTAKAGAEAADPQILREWLGTRLPAHMVPDIIELLEEMPRLPNGKIDRRNLAARPLYRHVDRKMPPAAAGPDNGIEEKLAEIWSELLGVHPILRDDNFFELGGDSIVAIQFLSRARQAGISLQPSDIADHQTIAALARASCQDGAGSADATAPLLPVQHRYLHGGSVAIGDAALVRRFHLDARVPPEHLRQAIAVCAEIHPALRTGFEKTDAGWRQIGDLAAPELTTVTLAKGTVPEIQTVEAAARSRLTLDGSLAQIVYVEKDGGDNQLLVVLHPLIADETSLQILIEDIGAAATDLIAGRIPVLKAPPSPWKLAETMAAYADTARMVADIACWAEIPGADAFCAPLEIGTSVNPHQRIMIETRHALDPVLGARILSDANQAYNTEPPEVLLAGLAIAITRATGRFDTVIALETEGRNMPLQDQDLSRTIAPLATTYPVHFEAVVADDPAGTLKIIKETYRRYRKGATSYAIACHLAAQAVEWPRPSLLFTFRDGGAEPAGSTLLSPVEAPDAPAMASLSVDLRLNATAVGDGLHLSLLHDPARTSADAVTAFLMAWERALVEVTADCAAQTAGNFTPSDFPEADLDQSELDDFLNALDADDG